MTNYNEHFQTATCTAMPHCALLISTLISELLLGEA